jgi:hypothetical protein
LADLINDGGPILHHGDREEQQRSVRVHLPEALEIPQSIQD